MAIKSFVYQSLATEQQDKRESNTDHTRELLMNTNAILDQYFQALEQAHKFSGVVLITQGATPLYARAYGYASRSWQIGNSLDIRFDTASVTKLFTAVATLQLIDQD